MVVMSYFLDDPWSRLGIAYSWNLIGGITFQDYISSGRDNKEIVELISFLCR